jgi:hypothetical protein
MGRMTSRKYYGKMKVNGKDDIPYIMENKTCLKPPTRWYKGNNPVDKSIVSFPIGEGVFVTKMEEMRSGGYCDKMGT